MLLRRLANIVFVALAFTAPAAAWAEPVVDKPAPEFAGKTADGKTLDLKSLRGKTVVLEWTNHECPFVKKHYESGNIPQLQKDATAQGIVWLQVISSAPDKEGYVDGATAIKLNKFRDAAPTNTVLDPEGTIGRLYGAQTSPHLFIINPEGVLVYKGGIDSIPSADPGDIAKAENYVKSALSELKAGKKVSKSSTRPYGCTVKYAS
ncbi:redoxin domain-containing protein [Methylococcus sp. EFPC2]|uniref:redoxin domain-containing protein n=1 Tax=Methylococcus sp. EFPC2 TaxID=2812648 RepID=UPI001967ACD4|nr:redoxin domain-containing protein [Methylococcus sp. EFPC2]QSA96421.1 redoxin domain-containing protein [Methylococcus sp. EFPC2]